MKLTQNIIEVDGSTDFTEETFSVGNAGIIFDILRNKLYSNAVESICREYSSNARDAHREIGTFDRPIEIHFPNAFDSNFIIKDYGTGISKNRMSNVFIKYGNSTKREDNIQLGSYGCGAKSGFSYTNSFSVVTIAKENNINTKCTYIAYLDESSAGKIRLVREENTTESTGTSIIIPVQEKDVQAFIDGTLKSTQYWPIRPIFFGLNPLPEYPSVLGDLLAESDGWKIYNVKNYNTYNRSKAESLAIIDGIQYKLNENFINNDDRWILNCNVHLFFGIGELTLSASRETLQYDEATIKLLNDRIKLVQKELSDQILNIIDKKDSYVEAVEFYTFMSTHFHKVLKNNIITWRGLKIIGSDITITTYILNTLKAKISGYREINTSHKKSIKLSRDFKIYINKGTEIYYNDLDPEHTYRNKNLKALESNNYIQIINYIKDKTYDDFVAEFKLESIKYFSNPGVQRYGDIDNSWIFDIIKPKLLSSVIEDKLPKTPPKPKVKVVKNDKIKCYRYYRSSGWQLKNYFCSTSVDTDVEGCYVETVFKDNSIVTKYNNKSYEINYKYLSEIKKIIGDINIYSVKEKDIPKFTKLKPLYEVLKDNYIKLTKADYNKSLAMWMVLNDYNSSHRNFFDDDNLKLIIKNKNKILDKKSEILKYEDYAKYKSEELSTSFITYINEILNIKDTFELYRVDCEILLTEIKNRYPLLKYTFDSADIEHIISYINMCDNNFIHKEINKIALGA